MKEQVIHEVLCYLLVSTDILLFFIKLYDNIFIHVTVSGAFLNCEGSGLYELQSACMHYK